MPTWMARTSAGFMSALGEGKRSCILSVGLGLTPLPGGSAGHASKAPHAHASLGAFGAPPRRRLRRAGSRTRPLRRRGLRLAIDDVGTGFMGRPQSAVINPPSRQSRERAAAEFIWRAVGVEPTPSDGARSPPSTQAPLDNGTPVASQDIGRNQGLTVRSQRMKVRLGQASAAWNPVVEAVIVGLETMVHAPEHSIDPVLGSDLAIRGADVGLHRIDRQIHQR